MAFLTPRMTSAEKSAIFNPATGLLIFQTDNTPGFYFYNGSSWIPFNNLNAPGTIASVTSFMGGINIIPANAAGYIFAGATAQLILPVVRRR